MKMIINSAKNNTTLHDVKMPLRFCSFVLPTHLFLATTDVALHFLSASYQRANPHSADQQWVTTHHLSLAILQAAGAERASKILHSQNYPLFLTGAVQ